MQNMPMMRNTQPVEGFSSQTESLDVINVWETIQGEGPHVGRPAVFIRLAGCNLQCPLCDTNYTQGRRMMTPTEIVQRVQDTRHAWPSGNSPLSNHSFRTVVVISGGEPFRQELKPLIRLLLDAQYQVQVETNGTYYPERLFADEADGIEGLTIVCSPKSKVHPKLWGHITALKYVVTDGQIADDGLPLAVLGNKYRPARPPQDWFGSIYIQPLDEQDPEANRKHTAAAVGVCLQFGYLFCPQIHKAAGLE